jgi:hypothetical protein
LETLKTVCNESLGERRATHVKLQDQNNAALFSTTAISSALNVYPEELSTVNLMEVVQRPIDDTKCKRGELWGDRSLILHPDTRRYSHLFECQILVGKHFCHESSAPTDFSLLSGLRRELKGKRFSDVKCHKSYANKTGIIPVQYLENCSERRQRRWEQNWREITLENTGMLISVVFGIKKTVQKIICPTLYLIFTVF